MRWISRGLASSPSWIRAGFRPLSARSRKVAKVATKNTGTKIAIERARFLSRVRYACLTLATVTPWPLSSLAIDGHAGEFHMSGVAGQSRDRLALGEQVRLDVKEDQR